MDQLAAMSQLTRHDHDAFIQCFTCNISLLSSALYAVSLLSSACLRAALVPGSRSRISVSPSIRISRSVSDGCALFLSSWPKQVPQTDLGLDCIYGTKSAF